jgi:hypothetical protein
MPDQNEIEIGDVEGYSSDKLHQFNHQSLVMEMMRKVIEKGSHEMRDGWWNEKRDKFGNVSRVYVEDTQETFSESVQTLTSLMRCDFDEGAEKNIKELEEKLTKARKDLLKGQDDWWSKLNPLQRNRFSDKNMSVIPGKFNFNLIWYKTFIKERIKIYRSIFTELNLLTKRLDFYKQEEYMG